MTDSEHATPMDPAELQDQLEVADPADAPDIAEKLAARLGDDLDERATTKGDAV